MIDPYDLTKPWDETRLQEWLLFGICVAGKNANQTAAKVERFLYGLPTIPGKRTPFQRVQYLIDKGMLGWRLRLNKLGQYKRINKAFREVIRLDPETVTIEELEGVHGVGAKTARMYALYTRPDQQVIPLDTHILKWLRANGYDAPKGTPPPGRKYRELEAAFIAEGRRRGLTPKQWDTEVWQFYANR